MTEHLPECPFCNRSDKLSIKVAISNGLTAYLVECGICFSAGPMSLSEEGAKQAWAVRYYVDGVRKAFNDAINFAIADSEPRAFLTAWREGDWDTLKKEWPKFQLPKNGD